MKMFQFFWRELQLIGVRVYEPEDYEKAIAMSDASHVRALYANMLDQRNLGGLIRAGK